MLSELEATSSNNIAPEIRRVGVIGLGSIGSGVCQSVAAAGLDVVALDQRLQARDELRGDIRRMALASRLTRNSHPVDEEELWRRISLADGLVDFATCDAVIENITEDVELKRVLYAQLKLHTADHCLFVVNTSCIPIREIASWIGSSRVVGAHFMNPVPLKDTVEMISPEGVAPEIVTLASEFMRKLGKKSVWVNDDPGFVTNRILMPMINDAIGLVERGVASPSAVDQIFMGCLAHKMGPLATADLIGLDTIKKSLEVLLHYTGDTRFSPTALLTEMVENGLLGRKSGEGFFRYAR